MTVLDLEPGEHAAFRLRLDHHVFCVVCDCNLDTYAKHCCCEPGKTCPGTALLLKLRAETAAEAARLQDRTADPAP